MKLRTHVTPTDVDGVFSAKLQMIYSSHLYVVVPADGDCCPRKQVAQEGMVGNFQDVFGCSECVGIVGGGGELHGPRASRYGYFLQTTQDGE